MYVICWAGLVWRGLTWVSVTESDMELHALGYCAIA